MCELTHSCRLDGLDGKQDDFGTAPQADTPQAGTPETDLPLAPRQ